MRAETDHLLFAQRRHGAYAEAGGDELSDRCELMASERDAQLHPFRRERLLEQAPNGRGPLQGNELMIEQLGPRHRLVASGESAGTIAMK